MKSLSFFFLILLISTVSAARGGYFSNLVRFYAFDDALALAKKYHKPMIAIHQQITRRGETLAKELEKNDEFHSLKDRFVYATWVFPEKVPPVFKQYHINPVVIMYSSDGVPFYDIVNDNAENTYLYFQAEDLVFSMKQMLLRQQYVDEFKQSPLYKKSLCKD